jgi:predicted nucleotidyltransferase
MVYQNQVIHRDYPQQQEFALGGKYLKFQYAYQQGVILLLDFDNLESDIKT